MALSNQKDAISTYQILVDIANSLKVISDDPKALQKTVKEAEDKGNEVRSLIVQNEVILGNIRKEKAECVEIMDAAESVKKENVAKEISLNQMANVLNQREKELNAAIASYDGSARELERLQREVSDKNNSLNADKIAFEAHKKATQAYEESLRDKAEQLKTLTESI